MPKQEQPFTENADGDVIVPHDAAIYNPINVKENERQLREMHPEPGAHFEYTPPIDGKAVIQAIKTRLRQTASSETTPESHLSILPQHDRGAVSTYVRGRELVLGGSKPRKR